MCFCVIFLWNLLTENRSNTVFQDGSFQMQFEMHIVCRFASGFALLFSHFKWKALRKTNILHFLSYKPFQHWFLCILTPASHHLVYCWLLSTNKAHMKILEVSRQHLKLKARFPRVFMCDIFSFWKTMARFSSRFRFCKLGFNVTFIYIGFHLLFYFSAAFESEFILTTLNNLILQNFLPTFLAMYWTTHICVDPYWFTVETGYSFLPFDSYLLLKVHVKAVYLWVCRWASANAASTSSSFTPSL